MIVTRGVSPAGPGTRTAMDLGDPASYLVLNEGTPVLASGGEQVGRVEHVLADADADVLTA